MKHHFCIFVWVDETSFQSIVVICSMKHHFCAFVLVAVFQSTFVWRFLLQQRRYRHRRYARKGIGDSIVRARNVKKSRIEFFNTEASSKDALRRNKGRQSVRKVDVISTNVNTRAQ
jgi:hypothetical protein